jgi:hypothetical protein
MVVRMKENRLIFFNPRNPTPLLAGREYDLPKVFAQALLAEKRAEYRPGRLRGFAPKEIPAPDHHTRMGFDNFVRGLARQRD